MTRAASGFHVGPDVVNMGMCPSGDEFRSVPDQYACKKQKVARWRRCRLKGSNYNCYACSYTSNMQLPRALKQAGGVGAAVLVCLVPSSSA